jgi:hypothetical protein
MRHTSYKACLSFPTTTEDGVSPTTLRYGAAMDLLKEIKHASIMDVTAHFAKSGLTMDEDFLSFDPSCGECEKHELFDEDVDLNETIESYADVKKRVKTVKFFDLEEFNHLANALFKKDNHIWLKETHRANDFLHEFLSSLNTSTISLMTAPSSVVSMTEHETISAEDDDNDDL